MRHSNFSMLFLVFINILTSAQLKADTDIKVEEELFERDTYVITVEESPSLKTSNRQFIGSPFLPQLINEEQDKLNEKTKQICFEHLNDEIKRFKVKYPDLEVLEKKHGPLEGKQVSVILKGNDITDRGVKRIFKNNGKIKIVIVKEMPGYEIQPVEKEYGHDQIKSIIMKDHASCLAKIKIK